MYPAPAHGNDWIKHKKSKVASLGAKNTENNNENITRPADSVSFSGSAVSEDKKTNKVQKGIIFGLAAAGIGAAAIVAHSLLTKKPASQAKAAGDIYTKIASSEKFNKILEFTKENEAKLSALISLGLAGVLKPVVVLLMPGAEQKDKEVTATKNSISAVIGYILSCAILNPISSGVNEFTQNPEKYLKGGNKNPLAKQLKQDATEQFILHSKQELKNMTYKTNTLNALTTTYKRCMGLLVAPAKAAITIALMPHVLNLLFGDKGKKKEQEVQNSDSVTIQILNSPVLMNNMTNSTPAQNNVFAMFSEGRLSK